MNEPRVQFLDLYTCQAAGRQAVMRHDGRILGVTLVFLLLIMAAGFLYLSQASAVAELRYRLLDCEDEQTELCERIALLRAQIAMADSHVALVGRAERLGLVDAPADCTYLVCYVPPRQAPDAGDAPKRAALNAPQPAIVERLLATVAPKPQRQALRASVR